MNDTQRKATVGEIFNSIAKAKNKKERLAILTNHKANAGVQVIIRLQFDKRFKFALPEGSPPNLPENNTPNGMGEITILNSFKRLYLFLEGTSKTPQLKREQFFVGFLSGLDKQEADLMLAVKDKKLDVGLTRAIVDEVFPDLIPAEVKSPKKDEKGTEDPGNGESV